jgi:chromosome segregation ATPase
LLAQASLSDLSAQLNILKRPGPGDSHEVKALIARANNAERRLTNAQNQLAAAEEKMATMNQKTTAVDAKWEARVKEYETRLRSAEEKVKREKQGYKERVLELENQIRCVSVVGRKRAVLTNA